MIVWLAWWLHEHPEYDIQIDLSDNVTYWMMLISEIIFIVGLLGCLVWLLV